MCGWDGGWGGLEGFEESWLWALTRHMMALAERVLDVLGRTGTCKVMWNVRTPLKCHILILPMFVLVVTQQEKKRGRLVAKF